MPSLQCSVDIHHACTGCRCKRHAKISEQSQEIPARKRGAPAQIPAEIRARILADHDAGRAYTWIAAQLNRENVPTVRAKRWYAATIRTVVLSHAPQTPVEPSETDSPSSGSDGAMRGSESL